MFGSNFPVDSLSATYQETVSRHEAIVPVATHTDVFHNTAKRFYRIEAAR
jgi:predicted TIM-barrel fold metal-dependent hydrolase